MKSTFPLLFGLIALNLATAPVLASNLNRTATLDDTGIATVTPKFILGDIPLADGLEVPIEKNLLKITRDTQPPPAIAVGLVDVDEVYNFYKRVLPALGWKAISGRDYIRDDKSLHIDVRSGAKLTTVIFTETPLLAKK